MQEVYLSTRYTLASCVPWTFKPLFRRNHETIVRWPLGLRNHPRGSQALAHVVLLCCCRCCRLGTILSGTHFETFASRCPDLWLRFAATIRIKEVTDAGAAVLEWLRSKVKVSAAPQSWGSFFSFLLIYFLPLYLWECGNASVRGRKHASISRWLSRLVSRQRAIC